MTDAIADFAPSMEQLGRDADPNHALTFPILGLRVRFETNSRQVLRLVEDKERSWGSRHVESATAQELTIRIVVREGREYATGRAEVGHISTDDGRLIIRSAGSVGVVDPIRRESIAYVTSELVADRARFQVPVLEAMTFALLASQDRHPIHAAAIGGPDLALLLAGESGAGKSTLALLAYEHGLRMLSEDRVWVALEPSLRVWSASPRVHLGHDALPHFPELSNRVPHIEATPGKVAIDIADVDGCRAIPATRAVVCVLARGRQAALERVDAPTLVSELQRQTAPGFDRFPKRHERVLKALTTGGGWRLTLSSTPNDALPCLKRMLEES